MEKPTRILLVDDEEMILELLKSYFERKGYDVVTAVSGNTAFEAIKSDPSIKLIVSDIRMDDGTGVDLLNNVQSLPEPRPPLIFVSGFSEITEKDALAKGAEAYFVKPIDRKSLFAKVEECLARVSEKSA